MKCGKMSLDDNYAVAIKSCCEEASNIKTVRGIIRVDCCGSPLMDKMLQVVVRDTVWKRVIERVPCL